MNKRYNDLVVKEGVYVPSVGLDYPEDDPYQGIYKPVYDHVVKVDADYPFVDDSFKNKFNNWVGYLGLVYFLLAIRLYVRMGLRVKGRHWLRQYKAQLKHGAITISNHVFNIDCVAILLAIRGKHTTKVPMFAPNFGTKDEWYLRAVGGIPIPPAEEGMTAMKRFNEAFDEFDRRGYWFHIFPETKRWDFYKPIRPFQKGAFTMAYKYNRPVIPCTISYRERTGIYRLFGPKEVPLLQVEIGEPVLPDTTQPRRAEVERMCEQARNQMIEMAGIVHNTWE